jgi:hypothetical protein
MKDILERLEQKMDAGFAQVDKRFEQVDAQLQKQGVLLEDIRGDAKMALEGIIGNREATDRGFADVLRKLDERVQPLELAGRQFGRELTTRAKSSGKRRRD